jgi:hypothetical protein
MWTGLLLDVHQRVKNLWSSAHCFVMRIQTFLSSRFKYDGNVNLSAHFYIAKAVPLHTMEIRYSSYSFSTSALDGREWLASRPGRALALGKGPTVPIVQEAGLAPEPVWTQRLEEKSFASAGDRTPIARSSILYRATILRLLSYPTHPFLYTVEVKMHLK